MATADATNTIAESLKETEEIPRKQIADIVSVLGADVALELLAETRKVQDSGGVEVRDGTRRRTDGGVFFSLAKARLPKPDRNRIFRIRPPRPEGEPSSESEPVSETAATVPRPMRPVSSGKPVQDAALAGRRRVVEVEVLRKPGAPAPVVLPVRDVAPPPRPEARVVPEERPLRRLVVGSANREEPPTTAEAARDRIRTLLERFSEEDKRRVLESLLEANGGAAQVRVSTVDDKLREHVLASVTDALGLSSGDLARALYGDENPSARSKARLALDRWRKTREP